MPLCSIVGCGVNLGGVSVLDCLDNRINSVCSGYACWTLRPVVALGTFWSRLDE